MASTIPEVVQFWDSNTMYLEGPWKIEIEVGSAN